jgi:hypothetical protein
MILAIDPGNIESGYVFLNNDLSVVRKEKILNKQLLELINFFINYDSKEETKIAIEMIASYGMAVGQTVFETCLWIGRFIQEIYIKTGREPTLIYRKDEKINLCQTMKAKDSNIRQALIDRFAKHDFKNGKGTKNNQDIFYGFKSDIWAAMAVGVTYFDMYIEPNLQNK